MWQNCTWLHTNKRLLSFCLAVTPQKSEIYKQASNQDHITTILATASSSHKNETLSLYFTELLPPAEMGEAEQTFILGIEWLEVLKCRATGLSASIILFLTNWSCSSNLSDRPLPGNRCCRGDVSLWQRCHTCSYVPQLCHVYFWT